MGAAPTLANWLVAAGTLILAVVAVFQETIRGWFYRPKFQVSISGEPPDCHAVAFTRNGEFVADSIYLRLWVKNVGNATAKNAEVYAEDLQRQRADGNWERVVEFPPMNLKWADIGKMYFPLIAPEMGKHCAIGHIVDPARRHLLSEDSPRLNLSDQQSSLAFDLIVAPNHRGHIIGPGEYRLKILVAAENISPTRNIIAISLRGIWAADETRMLRDGVGVRIVQPDKEDIR